MKVQSSGCTVPAVPGTEFEQAVPRDLCSTKASAGTDSSSRHPRLETNLAAAMEFLRGREAVAASLVPPKFSRLCLRFFLASTLLIVTLLLLLLLLLLVLGFR